MKMHVHIGALEALHFALMLIVIGFLMRMVEVTWPESKVGQALAFVH